jgi:hypothetical protein
MTKLGELKNNTITPQDLIAIETIGTSSIRVKFIGYLAALNS